MKKSELKNSRRFANSINITSLKPLALPILLDGDGNVGGVERLAVAGSGGGAHRPDSFERSAAE